MAFCGNCGAKIEDGEKFCPACGTPLEAEAAVNETAANEPGAQENTYQAPEAAPAADGSLTFDRVDVDKNKVISAIGNVPFLFWLPLVSCKESKFGKYNANRGLVYLIVYVILGVVFSGILPWLFGLLGSISSGFAVVFGILSVLLSIVTWVLYLALSAAVILSFVFAITAQDGQMKPVPVIGGLIDKLQLIK